MWSSRRVEVERRARAEIVAVRREEGFSRAAALIAQHDEEIPLGIELGGIAELGHGGARDAVDAHLGPAGALAVAGVGDLPQQRHHAQLLEQGRIEGDLVDAVDDVTGRARRARALDRIDLNQDRIVRRAVADQRRDGGIARIAAVPIGLAVDLDGLKQRRQAGGGEQHLGRQVGVAENVPAPGVHIGGRDEQLHLRFGDATRSRCSRQGCRAKDWRHAD